MIEYVNDIFVSYGGALPADWYAFSKGQRPSALRAAHENKQELAGRRVRSAHGVEVRQEVWERDGARCVACGSPEELEYDHIIPLSQGGSDSLANTQLLCLPWNRRKGRKIG